MHVGDGKFVEKFWFERDVNTVTNLQVPQKAGNFLYS